MFSFVPEFEGEMTFEPLPDDFVSRIRSRVESGLLSPGSRARADYVVHSADRDAISFGAEGLLTAYNIGLNEVTVRRSGRDQLRYHVTYWRWTLTAVAHGLISALVMAGVYLLAPGVRQGLAARSEALPLAGAMVAFFCLAWPWLLSAFHRRFAEQALRHILRETLSGPAARAA